MANRYWVGGTGTWNNSNTANWSASSGGTGGASLPTGGDVVFFDSNSNVPGSGASYTVTLGSFNFSMANLTVDNPSSGILTFAGTGNISASTIDIGATVNCPWSGFILANGSTLLNTNGNTIGASINIQSTLTLSGNSAVAGTVTLANGGSASRFFTNGFDLTCSTFTSQANGTITPVINSTGGGSISVTSISTGTVINIAYNGTIYTGPVTFNIIGNAPNGVTRSITNLGSGTFNLNLSAGSDTFNFSGSYGSANFTGFTGTINQANVSLTGNLIIPSAVTLNSTAAISFGGSSLGNTVDTQSKTINSVSFNGTGSWNIDSPLVATGTLTLTSGILNINNSINCGAFTSTANNNRQLAFVNNSSINITGTTTATVLNVTGTLLTVTGTPDINLIGNAASGIVRTVTMGTGLTASNSLNLNVNAGQSGNIVRPTTPFNVKNLNFANSTTSTLDLSNASVQMTVFGNLVLPTTVTGSASQTTTFSSTQPGNTILTNGSNLWRLVFDGVGGEWILQDNLVQNSTVTSAFMILNSGRIDLNDNILNVRGFNSSNTATRSVDFGSTGQITISSSQTNVVLWNTVTTTGLTYIGTPNVVFATGIANQNLTISAGANPTNPPNFYFPMNTPGLAFSGTGTLTVSGDVNTLDFTNLPGVLRFAANTNINIYGDLILNSNVNSSLGAVTLNFLSDSNSIVNQNGSNMSGLTAMNFIGTGTWDFSSAIIAPSAIITHSSGTINTGGFSISALAYQSTGANSRSLNLSASTVTVSGTGATVAWAASSSLSLSSGTSSIICTGAAPTFNGGDLSYYDVTFNNSSVTGISISGDNSYNNLSFATPTVSNYPYVLFSDDQTINGALAITGSTVGNFRLFFKSSQLDAQRTIYAETYTNLSDIDFRDIIATGPALWVGTRLGDAGNNSGITFTAPKSVWYSRVATPYNWSKDTWALTNGGATSAVNFPLPQDTIAGTFGSVSAGARIIVNFGYAIGNLNYNIPNGSGLTISTNDATFMGDVNITLTNATFSGIMTFYNRANAVQTLNYTETVGTFNIPIVINTNGTVQLGTAFRSTSYISHIRGNFNTQNFTLTITYYDSSFSGNLRTLNLGSSVVNMSYSVDTNLGFTVLTDGFTFNAGTSTINITSNQSFGVKSDNDLVFYNVNYTNGLFTSSLTGSIDPTLYTVAYTYNNLTYVARSSSSGVSSHLFTGMSSITVNNLLSIDTGSTIVRRTALISLNRIVEFSSGNSPSFGNVDFSGINVISNTWTATNNCGNGGRNTNITFQPSKTSYWNGTTGGNWSSTFWAASLGGATSINNFPLAHDTAIFTAVGQPGNLQTVTHNDDFLVGTLDASGSTSSWILANQTATMYTSGDVTLPSPITVTGTNAWAAVGDGIQNINISATLPLQFRVICSGTVRFGTNLICTNANGLSLVAGSIDLNSRTVNAPVLTSILPLVRNIDFNSGSINVTGNAATIINIPASGSDGLTINGIPNVNLTYSLGVGTRTINTTGINSQNKAFNINATAGSDVLSFFSGSGMLNLTTQGFTGTWGHTGAINLYGNLTVGTGVTTIQDVSFNYVGSGSSTLTTNGKTLRGQLTINTSSGTLSQQDSLTLTQFSGGNISYFRLQQGIYDANGQNLTIDRFIGSGSNTRTLNMGSGTWTLSSIDNALANNSVWDIGSSTLPIGLSLNCGTSTISISGNGTKTFNGGSQTYNNLAVDGPGELVINGFNTFNTLSNSTTAMNLKFNESLPQKITNFNISGTVGNLIPVTSTTSNRAILYKPTAWNVGTNSVDGGNNSGLIYSAGSSDYLTFSNIEVTNVDPGSPADYFTNANVSWIGLQALAKLARDVSTSWVGMQVLSSTFGNNPTPAYLDFGTIASPIPNTIYFSTSQLVSGLSTGLLIDVFSNENIEFSIDGVNYSSTIQIQNGDNLSLRVTLQNIASRNMSILTTLDSLDDVEIGKWAVQGPSDSLIYSQYIYRNTVSNDWDEYSFNWNSNDDALVSNYFSSNSIFGQVEQSYDLTSPLGFSNTEAPTSEHRSQLSVSESLAPSSIFNKPYNALFTASPVGKFNTSVNFKYTDQTMTYYTISYDSNGTKLVVQDFKVDQNNLSIFWDVLTTRSTVWNYKQYYVDAPVIGSAMISEKLNNIMVSKFYEMDGKNKNINYNPVQEVWNNWQSHSKMADWETINESVAPTAITNWNHYSQLATLAIIDTDWMHNRYNWPILSNILEAKNDPYGFHLTNIVMADYVISENSIFSEVLRTSDIFKHVNNITVAMNPYFDTELIYESTNYVRQGGYPTFELATDAATMYSSYPTDVYIQPEGTYTFLVNHDMALVCSLNPGSLRIVAWLMGGG